MVESVFFLLYTFPALLHYFMGAKISYYDYMNHEPNIIRTLTILTTFFTIFAITVSKKNIEDSEGIIRFKIYHSNFAYTVCMLMALICLTLGRRGSTIFDSGGYGRGIVRGSAIYEYIYIFILLAYIFSGQKKNKKYGILLLTFVYILKSMLYGARVEIVAICILVFCIYFQNSFSNIQLALLLVAAYLTLAIFGMFRGDLDFSQVDLFKSYGYYSATNMVMNNESDSFYTSLVIVSSVYNNLVTLGYRIISALYFIIKFFIPGSLVNAEYNVVAMVNSNITTLGGGGFCCAYWFFYFGWAGVFFIGWLCGHFWNKIGSYDNLSPKWQIFLMMTLVMMPRWFAYSPEAMIKIPLFTVIGYTIFEKILHLSSWKYKRNKGILSQPGKRFLRVKI